jgi:ATP-dependent DNA helicase RecG
MGELLAVLYAHRSLPIDNAGWKLRPPEISEEGSYVKVVIRHAPLALPTEAIMNFLEANESITNAQARDLTGIRSENLVKLEFYKLRDQNLIERVPGKFGPASAWRKCDPTKTRRTKRSQAPRSTKAKRK